MWLSALNENRPRLFFPVDTQCGSFPAPEDPHRRRILDNIVDDCRVYARRKPWERIPERLDSPHPYHQLYITFYTAMQATALIEHYAFAWKITGNAAWLNRARAWMLAAANWEHSDRVEEHFYTANRYMHAFAFALDLLWDQLNDREKRRITDCLVSMMERWWPDIERGRRSEEGGHHAVVDNAHFGVAALHLLDQHPDASQWLEAVIDRFRSSIMPNGCGRHGEPVDGASFWTWENLWLLQFADALRNVVGIDLCAEFPERLRRPLTWFRYQLVGPDAQGAGKRDAWSPTLLRLAQDAGDGRLRNTALADPDLGRIYRFMAGVKGSSAECVIAYGPYAYLFCDPGFATTRFRPKPHALSRRFRARYGDTVVMRDGWGEDALIAQVCGYDGGVAHNFSELHLHLAGHPVLKVVSSEEAQPVACGSLPSVGNQNEMVAVLGKLQRHADHDRLSLRSPRLHQEYWLLRKPEPLLLLAVKRRQRGVRSVMRSGVSFVQLNGKDYLQYDREPFFNPDAGTVRLRVRLYTTTSNRTQVLFNTGFGLGSRSGPGPQVNNFTVAIDKVGLFFRVQSQRGHSVEVRPPESVELTPKTWHDVRASWGGFNKPGGKPVITIALDGTEVRCSGADRFGELGRDSQQLRSRSSPRDFHIRSNTIIAIGGAVQLENTGTRCDVQWFELHCRSRKPLHLDFAAGLGNELGSEPPLWKLNPVKVLSLTRSQAHLKAGPLAMDVLPILPHGASCQLETVPYAPAGLAGGSLRRLSSGGEENSSRLRVAAEDGDILVLILAPSRSKVQITHDADSFILSSGGQERRFSLSANSRQVLEQG